MRNVPLPPSRPKPKPARSTPRRLEVGEYRSRQLDGVIDGLHALFDQWTREARLDERLDEASLEQARVALHEWIANLVQHADFGDRRPDIRVSVQPREGALRCAVEDNSNGFDLDAELPRRQLSEAFPERGMGLLMLQACTDDLVYRSLPDGRHRLTFLVAPGRNPHVEIPF